MEPDTLGPESVAMMRARLLRWFRRHRRRLPWRETTDPYAILVSEVMLQQTQVDRVLPKYHEFLQRFPTIESLAAASVADVLRIWAPLGYNLRAVRLHRTAVVIAKQHYGQVPRNVETLQRLPGLGPYTAAAIACFAHGERLPVLDTNIKRVLARFFSGTALSSTNALQRIASSLLPRGRPKEWNLALMDLGALICTARRPQCTVCPIRETCATAPVFLGAAKRIAEPLVSYRTRAQVFKGSQRYFRGRIVDCLRGVPPRKGILLERLGSLVKPDFVQGDLPWLQALVRDLEKDGLVAVLQDKEEGEPTGVSVRVSLPED